MMAKLAEEARNRPKSWELRGVRTIVMYPMNALVSDQISRLRRLIGDPQHRFVNIFRETAGYHARRPQFGMYTGRTPYAGPKPNKNNDSRLADTYSKMLHPEREADREFLDKLISDGKIPSKENFDAFLEKLKKINTFPTQKTQNLSLGLKCRKFAQIF